MGFYLAQGGSTLYKISTAGVATALTLPSGVTLSTARRPRFVQFDRQVLLVNSPSRSLWIDPDLTVRVMSMRAPAAPPLLSTSGTGLTGSYRVRAAFRVRDSLTGDLLNESPMSPPSPVLSCTNQGIAGSGVPIDPENIATSRVIYRTLADGDINGPWYEWLEVDGNVATSWAANATPDAALEIIPATEERGTPPGTIAGTQMELLIEWKRRLWGKSSHPNHLDELLFGRLDEFYAWPLANAFVANPKGEERGITAFLRRRDELGVGKLNRFFKVIGDDEANFELIEIQQGPSIGPVSQEAVTVIRDRAFYLGSDGVYEWSAGGIDRRSTERAHAWFTTDDYFNRAQFPNAISRYNPLENTYELGLAAAGSSVIDRWVSLELDSMKWLGPHKTAASTALTGALLLTNASGVQFPVFLTTEGYVLAGNQATRTDVASAIDFDVIPGYHSADTPDIKKNWLQASVFTKAEAGGTLQMIPIVGDIGDSEGPTISVDLTQTRTRTRYLGDGKFCRPRFRENTAGQDVNIQGYEIPFQEIGRY